MSIERMEQRRRMVKISVRKLADRAQVDRRKLGDGRPGPITKELQGVFMKAVRGELPKYTSWCTPVYKT